MILPKAEVIPIQQVRIQSKINVLFAGPESSYAALVYAPLRSVLNECHRHSAPSVGGSCSHRTGRKKAGAPSI